MASANDATMAAVVGGVAAALTTLFSKWIDSRNVERRDIQASRRLRDREQRREMEECEREKEILRDRIITLQLENSALRATLIAHNLAVPAFLQPHVP